MKEKNEFNSKTNSDSFLESKVDILRCISSLSNDEVFTPPHLVSDILDLLPEEIWRDKNITFLDPCCKTGVFLREITKRLIVGLSDEIPDLQERINHILTKQVFGIAITELTGLVSRRTVYCSKDANSKYSICTAFSKHENHDICYTAENISPNQYYRIVEHEGKHYYYPQEHQGNILYPHTEHEWTNGTCVKCGASQKIQDRGSELESHAYSFIHTDIKELFGNMKFDVIIGNPPYQLGNGKGSDIPLYHKFVNTAKSLNPKYISMIIPSRWLIGGKKELKPFRTQMLSDRKISFLYDFKNSRDCFSGVDIEGGVCYFLWDSKFEGKATVITNENGKIESSIRELLEDKMDTFIRDNLSINICKKVQANRENTFDSIVSSQTPFGLITSFNKFERKYFVNSLKLHKRNECVFVDEKYLTKNRDLINKHKVLISKSYGMGKTSPYQVLNHPFYSGPGECCTQTYLVISSFSDKIEAQNAISYMKTKFFRFMVYLKKISQDNGPGTFSLVPIQDFTKSWTDEELYRKYNLTDEEINYIESIIRPMN